MHRPNLHPQRRFCLKRPRTNTQDLFSCCHPKRSFGVFRHHRGQPGARHGRCPAHGLEALSIHHRKTRRSRHDHPSTTLPVHAHHGIRRQAVCHRVRLEPAIPVTNNAVERADPQRTIACLGKSVHDVACKRRRIRCIERAKINAIEPHQATFGRHPYEAISRLKDRTNSILRKSAVDLPGLFSILRKLPCRGHRANGMGSTKQHPPHPQHGSHPPPAKALNLAESPSHPVYVRKQSTGLSTKAGARSKLLPRVASCAFGHETSYVPSPTTCSSRPKLHPRVDEEAALASADTAATGC